MKRLAVVLALFPAAMFAQVLTPSQDAYVVPGNGTNFGAVQTLTVGSSASQGLVQFDLTHLPAGLISSQIGQATLTLFLDHVGAAVDLAIFIDGVGAVNGNYARIMILNNAGLNEAIAYWFLDGTLTLTPGNHTIAVLSEGYSGANATVSGDNTTVLQGALTIQLLNQ